MTSISWRKLEEGVLGCEQQVLICRLSQCMTPPRNCMGLPHPLSRQRVCPSPRNQRGVTLACGWGVGESQFQRLEKKLSTLATLWVLVLLCSGLIAGLNTVISAVKWEEKIRFITNSSIHFDTLWRTPTAENRYRYYCSWYTYLGDPLCCKAKVPGTEE